MHYANGMSSANSDGGIDEETEKLWDFECGTAASRLEMWETGGGRRRPRKLQGLGLSMANRAKMGPDGRIPALQTQADGWGFQAFGTEPGGCYDLSGGGASGLRTSEGREMNS